MKRICMLALVVTIVSSVFAETDPVFSGKFATYFTYATDSDVDKHKAWDDDYSISAKLALNGTIDEWNSVSAEFETKDAAFRDDDEINPIASLDEKSDYLRLKNFVIKTDVTGALGLGSLPVQLSVSTGKQKFAATSVANVAPASTKDANGGETEEEVGFIFDLKIMDKVTVSSHLFPKHLLNNAKGTEAGVSIKATDIALGPVMLDVAAFGIWSESNFGPDDHKDNYTKFVQADYNNLNAAKKKAYDAKPQLWKIDSKKGKFVRYVATKNEEKDDEDGVDMGFNLAVKLMDNNLKIGLGVVSEEAANEKNEIGVQTDVAYTMGKLTSGISFGVENIDKFGKTASVILAANYDLFTALGIYGAVEVPFKDIAKKLKYDVGINTALKGLAIQVGWTNNLKYKAPEDDWNDTVFIKFSTSF